jgi:hypothetical protein
MLSGYCFVSTNLSAQLAAHIKATFGAFFLLQDSSPLERNLINSSGIAGLETVGLLL